MSAVPAERVFDSHLHFLDPQRLHYAWLADTPPLQRSWLPGSLDSGGYEVTGCLFVEADRRSEEAAQELGLACELAAGRTPPVIAGFVAHVPLERGVGAGPIITSLADNPLVVGVRRLLQDEPAGFACHPELIDAVRLLAPSGLVFDICIRSYQFGEVIDLVERCPDVTFVLDHLGKPAVGRGRAGWAVDLRALAGHPNVYCKLSGLTSAAEPGHRRHDVLPYLREAVDAFSPGRCMYGSDWPVALLSTSYVQWLESVLEAIDDLTVTERAQILRGTVDVAYRRLAPAPVEESTC